MAENSDIPLSTNKRKMPISVFFQDARRVFKMDALGKEIIEIALPAAMALAADPIASIIDTAFIGHLGPVEIAAVGVSIAVFNQASRLTTFPLVSITTSFVAEEETIERVSNKALEEENAVEEELARNGETNMKTKDINLVSLENGSEKNTVHKESSPVDESNAEASKSSSVTDGSSTTNKKAKRHIPSASTALIIGAVLGILQAILLVFGAKVFLGFMGVKPGSTMLDPALQYLKIRALGSPAILFSVAMQGVFRGCKDTKTPLYATVAADVTNIILDPILIYACHLRVSGAAIAHVLSQYLMSLILFARLMGQVHLLPPSLKDLKFSRFLRKGGLLLARVLAVTFCLTLAASLAARLGSTKMAAFQICLQVWMTSSLLADGLAVAGQAILASSFAEKDYKKTTAAASRVLQMGFILGLGLAVVVGVGLRFGSGIFTKDVNVQHVIFIGVPFVAASQPINSLAFVFDGINLGASEFAYFAYSMVIVASATISALFLLSKSNGFVGIWIALTIFMALRALAGAWRMGTGIGPWRFLRS